MKLTPGQDWEPPTVRSQTFSHTRIAQNQSRELSRRTKVRKVGLGTTDLFSLERKDAYAWTLAPVHPGCSSRHELGQALFSTFALARHAGNRPPQPRPLLLNSTFVAFSPPLGSLWLTPLQIWSPWVCHVEISPASHRPRPCSWEPGERRGWVPGSISKFSCSLTRKTEILHHAVWRTWLFVAFSDENYWYKFEILTTSHYTFFFKTLGECTSWTWEWTG